VGALQAMHAPARKADQRGLTPAEEDQRMCGIVGFLDKTHNTEAVEL
jgi:hypothetical protein